MAICIVLTMLRMLIHTHTHIIILLHPFQLPLFYILNYGSLPATNNLPIPRPKPPPGPPSRIRQYYRVFNLSRILPLRRKSHRRKQTLHPTAHLPPNLPSLMAPHPAPKLLPSLPARILSRSRPLAHSNPHNARSNTRSL